MTTRWTIGIDWDRDGNYTDETARVLPPPSGSVGFQQAYMNVGNDAQFRLAHAQRGQALHAGEQPWPLSGKLAPLRPVKIESNDGTTTRVHWSGWIAAIVPAAGKYGNRQVPIFSPTARCNS